MSLDLAFDSNENLGRDGKKQGVLAGVLDFLKSNVKDRFLGFANRIKPFLGLDVLDNLGVRFNNFLVNDLGPILRILDIDIDSGSKVSESNEKYRIRGGSYGVIENNLASYEENLNKLERALYNRGLDRESVNSVLSVQKRIYSNMYNHLGTQYEGKVNIKNYDGTDWTIKNSCTGNAMKVAEGLPLKVINAPKNANLKGGKGRWLSSFVWSLKEDWLESVVRSDSDIVKIKGLRPDSADEQIKKYLLPGEAAPALLWNHAIWLYRDLDTDQIMIHHSGADVRAKKLNLKPGEKTPSGYELLDDGVTAVKKSGSKVNVLPFAEFLSSRSKMYCTPGKDWLNMVPVSKLVEINNLSNKDLVG